MTYEWTNDKDAMRSALRSLNEIVLNIPHVEESAKEFALNVRKMLDFNETADLPYAWLVDALHQTSIDYQANKH